MRPRSRWLVPLTAGLGLCLLVLAIRPRAAHRPPERLLPISPQRYAPAPPRTPCERALREARSWLLRAVQQVNEEREALEAAAPGPVPGDVQEAWWRQLMVRDRSGALHRARVTARRAAALARTRDEKYHVALLLTRLECYAGHHRDELRQARRLIALHPGDPSAVQALRHAAACNRIELGSRRQRSETAPAQRDLARPRTSTSSSRIGALETGPNRPAR
jgi:hypothetical protein